MNTPAQEPWVERAVALLDQSAQSFDAATLVRLNHARQAALAQRRGAWQGWLLGGGLAAGATLALVIALGIGQRATAPPTRVPAATEQGSADATALTDDDNLDLYENLDFYVWLDAEQHADHD